jgi:hypothetical protein
MVSQHFVSRFHEQLQRAFVALGLADIGSFASKPQNQQIATKRIGHVDGPKGTVNCILACLRIVASVSAIDRHRAEPKARGDQLHKHSRILDHFTYLLGFLENLTARLGVDVRHDVIVVKHDRIEPTLLESLQFPDEILSKPGFGTIGVAPFTDVPRTEDNAILKVING